MTVATRRTRHLYVKELFPNRPLVGRSELQRAPPFSLIFVSQRAGATPRFWKAPLTRWARVLDQRRGWHS